MTDPADQLEQFRRDHGLPPSGVARWTFRLGPFEIGLPNFRWRQTAIDAHDQHHVITGYPLTIAGEIQLAAWEWGAGRYPDWRATMFCAPLIAAGVLAMPLRTLNAFTRGRKAQSLYHKLDRTKPRR